MRAQRSKLHHLGIRSTVARNTLANALRNWRIYADFAQSLIAIARPLYIDEPWGCQDSCRVNVSNVRNVRSR